MPDNAAHWIRPIFSQSRPALHS